MKALPLLTKPNLSNLQTHESHFISLIHSSKTTTQLKQIHTQLLLHNLSQSSRIITQLISYCFAFKSVSYPLLIFKHFHQPTSFLFNSIIRGLFENTQTKKSVYYFVLMLKLGALPDRLTFPFVLKSVAALGEFGVGRGVHGQITKRGVEFDSFVRVSLVDMYGKVGHLGFGLQLFDETPERNRLESILLWNVLINGCCKVGDVKRANEIFEAMPERNVGSWNSMINGFLRKGHLEQAKLLFDQMPDKDVVTWTTMVAGLSQNEDHEQALGLYHWMLDKGVKPNDLTLVSALSACAKLGALGTGMQIYEYILQKKNKLSSAVGNALADMFAKCGKIECASRVFREMKTKDLLTWTIMISGWAMHGCSERALQFFEDMISTGIKPDGVVFLAVLTACSHAGLVDRGLQLFNSMKLDYSIEPTVKHYTCMVDLFGRAGQLEEALDFVQKMPLKADFVVWGALFCACRANRNIKMAELTSEKLLQLEPKHPGSYVFLSNIYAGVGRWQDVEKVRLSMKTKGLEKPPAWSYIEVEGRVHRFVANDHAHNRAKEIYSKLEELTVSAKLQGYMPNTEWVLHNIEEEEKEDALGSHSEKLALAFGLISTSTGTSIRIVKNLRVCGDCHSLMKHVSLISKREIILRDIKRFHLFKDGACTCGDYWFCSAIVIANSLALSSAAVVLQVLQERGASTSRHRHGSFSVLPFQVCVSSVNLDGHCSEVPIRVLNDTTSSDSIITNNAEEASCEGIQHSGRRSKEYLINIKAVEEQLQTHRSWISLISNKGCNGRGIFVYDLPTKFNKELVEQCSKMVPWVNFCDYFKNNAMGEPIEKLGEGWYSTHQYSLEPIFHSRVLKHPCRVYNESSAKLFYVPYYGGLDVLRWHFKNTSGNIKDSLGIEVLQWLEMQHSWKKNNGSDHVFVLGKISWDFRRHKNESYAWGSNFLEQGQMQNPLKLLIERQPWHINDIGVPHPTHFHPHTDQEIIEWQIRVTHSNRQNLVSFAGAARPGAPENIRSVLIKQCTSRNDTYCQFLDCSSGICGHPENVIQLFMQSEFCLQPPGDSPTRKSVFDSLVSGCIPVLFDPFTAYYQYPWHLPRDHTRYSVFIDQEDVRDNSVNVVERLLKISQKERRDMRRYIVSELLPGLIYGDSSSDFHKFQDAFSISINNLLDRVEGLLEKA